ncbi:right-handed parallel beta-helix repeat-containing protein [Pseudolysobacter antarcticus]|uniref:Right-handed parallel beta-helix repeat-containing protein n=1 Tax=Pseudolysobacter antarcticus TaxID=2511995 RepID=A0A411HLQ4_9GAMM|nr:right-handed parallel beta-helix repeat-containing protein [Pseudolysobacter antarcticus]QBB71456.1 right-handed parallel beta-helix repeat-containing protein [Pseudolysobacter antarcticus]
MRSKMKLTVILLLLVASTILPLFASATTVCVNSVATLQNAIATWKGLSSGDMTIHIVQGNYPITMNGYTEPNGNATLSLLGGYTANCANRVVNPTNTVIDGQNSANVMFQISAENDVTVEGISFVGLRYGFVLFFDDFENGSGYTFTVRFNIFRDAQVDSSTTKTSAGVYIHGAPDSGGVNIYFQNNLVYDIAVYGVYTSTVPSVAIDSREDGFLAIGSNTIVANNTPMWVDFYEPGSGAAILENNIIYNGTATALDVSHSDAGPYARYNILGPVMGALSANVANLGADPLFVDINSHDYHLSNNSLAVNSGGPAVGIPGGYPSHDLDDKTRVVGSQIDRGAYESAFDDLNNITVTTAIDNGSNSSPTVGSLRWAIKGANANSGDSKISFSIPCPTLINISGPLLPDITTAVTIDGYTNSGATKNTSYASFNANLCVYLNGENSAGYGLHTSGSGTLTVRGLGFVGFTDAAVRLEGGAGNYVNGNQFGDVAFTVNNHDAVRITGASGHALIGGYDDPSVVNLIAGCSDFGIYIDNSSGGSSVANNLIGLGTNGVSANGNGNGVFIYNSPNNTLLYNYIVNSSGYGVEIAGFGTVSNNVVQSNVIGINPAGQEAGNAGGGVVIQGSYATNNIIGAPLNATYGGNTIAYNGGPGVWASASAGVGNRILANSIYSNGGLAIDLGTAGATANDTFDNDSGANDLQNYPVMSNAFRTVNQGEVLQGVLDSFNGNGAGFRLDFYYSSSCTGIGTPARGDTEVYLGTTAVYTDINGHAAYWVKLPLPFITTLGYVSATATAPDGSTSEIGECKLESKDLIFRSTFEGGGF